MMTAEQIQFIREEIKRQVNIILNAETGETTSQTETIQNLFPGMPGIENRPVAHPFGYVSRATEGTISVTVRVGDHTANRMVISHRDSERPDVEVGEVMLYNAFGDQIYVSQGVITSTTPKWVLEANEQAIVHSPDIRLGSEDADEPFVLGKVFKQFASDLLTQLQAETHVSGLPGFPTSVPQNSAQYANLKTSPIDDEKILSDEIFGEKG